MGGEPPITRMAGQGLVGGMDSPERTAEPTLGLVATMAPMVNVAGLDTLVLSFR